MKSNDHKKIMNRYIGDLDTINRNAALYSATRVPTQTRKFSGQARINTNMGINAPDNSLIIAPVYEVDAISSPIRRALRTFEQRAKTIRLGDKIFVSSALGYIEFLEYKFGDLMFTKAAGKWQEDVKRAISDT